MVTSGLLGPTVVKISFWLAAIICRAASFCSIVPVPSATLTVTSMFAFQVRGSIATQSLRRRMMRGLSWCLTIRNRMPLKSCFIPSARMRASSSTWPWLEVIVAATAALVVDWRASGSRPIEALDMPVRASLTLSM